MWSVQRQFLPTGMYISRAVILIFHCRVDQIIGNSVSHSLCTYLFFIIVFFFVWLFPALQASIGVNCELHLVMTFVFQSLSFQRFIGFLFQISLFWSISVAKFCFQKKCNCVVYKEALSDFCAFLYLYFFFFFFGQVLEKRMCSYCKTRI